MNSGFCFLALVCRGVDNYGDGNTPLFGRQIAAFQVQAAGHGRCVAFLLYQFDVKGRVRIQREPCESALTRCHSTQTLPNRTTRRAHECARCHERASQHTSYSAMSLPVSPPSPALAALHPPPPRDTTSGRGPSRSASSPTTWARCALNERLRRGCDVAIFVSERGVSRSVRLHPRARGTPRLLLAHPRLSPSPPFILPAFHPPRLSPSPPFTLPAQVFKPASVPAAALLALCPFAPMGWNAWSAAFLGLVCMSQQFHAW